VIGYIDAGSPEPAAHLVAAFLRGLGETGFVEGRNVTIERLPSGWKVQDART
jgi:putative tryptophan/tyrosine transport system substrate-binding protein